MNERIITSNECVAEGIAFLSNKDKHLKGMFKKVNSIPLRLRNPGFANLVSAIVSQQISVAAADAILICMLQNGTAPAAGIDLERTEITTTSRTNYHPRLLRGEQHRPLAF